MADHISHVSKKNFRQFFSFAVIGFLGFVTDAIVLLFVMKYFGMGPVSGRAISIVVAMTTTWLLNRRFTFAVKARASVNEGARYAAVKGVGQAANFIIYSLIIISAPGFHPIVALMIAAVAVLMLNFALVKRFVMRDA